MSNIRRCTPSQFFQGVDEELSYTVDVTNWATAPTAASATIWENSTNRGASNFSNSGSEGATISGAYITTPCLVSLRAGTDYRVEIKFWQSGKIYECYFTVTGET